MGDRNNSHNQFPLTPSGPRSSSETERDEDSGVILANKDKIERPKKYKVLLHNDDYTTMEFVVAVLLKFFGKSRLEAEAIMLTIHNEGLGVCGIYTFEVAESKASKVTRYARENGHPLKCTIEPCE